MTEFERNTTTAVIEALNTIEVKGLHNLKTLSACMSLLDAMVNDVNQNEQEKESNDG